MFIASSFKPSSNFISFLILCISMLLLGSCGESKTSSSPSDLNFEKITSKQDFCDLIIKAIKTNRKGIVIDKFNKNETIDENSLSGMINAYSQAIAKKKWDYEAYTYGKKDNQGYGYRWIDPYNRTAIIIEINSSKGDNGFVIDQIEFASRLEVLDSYSYPGGQLSEKRMLLNSKQGVPVAE